MTDDFSDHPETVTAIRANRASDGTLWTPRDCLIDTLRLIDKGEIAPTALIISYQARNEEGRVGAFNVVSTPDRHTALGLMVASIDLMQANR